MNKKNEKSFDCLAYKERVQAKIYELTKGMSPEEKVAFYHQGASEGPFKELWTRLTKTKQKEENLLK